MRKILALSVAAIFTVVFAGPAAACTTVPVAAPPTLTKGTCDTKGSVVAIPTDSYEWVVTTSGGTTIYTATAKGDYAISGQVEWPFDLSKLDSDDPLCRTDVTPAEPTFTPGTCLAAGVVNAPNSEHYKWQISGPATATVYTAIAEPGHQIAPSAPDDWTFDLTRVAWSDSACQPSFEVESDCGSVTITYVNASPWDRWPDYRIGDQTPSGDYGSGPVYTVVKVPAGQAAVIYSGSLAEDSLGGSVDVAYQDILGSESDISTPSTTVVVRTNCLSDVLPENAITAAQVMPIAPTCDVDGSLVLTNGDGYTWAGPQALGVGTHIVTATADEGWTFADNNTTARFTVVVLRATGTTQSTDANGGCYVAPVIVPPIVVPPVVDQPVVVPPVVTAAVLVASTTPTVSSPRVLAYTGIDGLPWLLFGATGLIGLGALTLTRTARERRVRAQA